MALLTVSKESALVEAGNSVLSSSVFQWLEGNFVLCAYLLHVTGHSTLTVRLAQKFMLAHKRRMVNDRKCIIRQ